MPGVKAILPTLRRRLSTGDIFKPARKLVKLSLHIRKDFITRVASKNVWVILAPSNGLIAIMNWFQKVSLNEMSGKVLTSRGIYTVTPDQNSINQFVFPRRELYKTNAYFCVNS